MNRPPLSDEILNAFVDNELSPAERARLLERVSAEAALHKQTCELHMLKDMVRTAYREPPGGKVTPGAPCRSRIRQAVAASLILGLGLGLGWATRDMLGEPNAVHIASLQSVSADPGRVVLHVDSGTPEHFAALLDYSERMLNDAKQHDNPLQIVVIANGGGVDQLRASTTQQGERIRAMQTSYPNLSFIGCGRALNRLKDSGHDTRLLPGVQQTPAALDAIIERMQRGWTYIKI